MTRTIIPFRRPAAAPDGPSSAPILASAWLMGLLLLAALMGAGDGHGACGPAPSIAPPAMPAPAGTAADPGPAMQDMLTHD